MNKLQNITKKINPLFSKKYEMSEKNGQTWRQAIGKSNLKSTTKTVLLALSTYMNEHGNSCFPSQSELANFTSLTPKSVRKHLKIASDNGWIESKKHEFSGQKWRRIVGGLAK